MSAKAQPSKEKVMADLIDVRRQILDAASSLPLPDQDEVFLGIWSVKDLLAHLMGWDYANLEAAQAVLAGRLPDFYAYHDRDWRTYNARLVAEYRKENFADLLASVQDSQRRLIDFLDTVPAAAFSQDTGVRAKGWKVTIARLLEAETTDERVHYAQIKAFAERNRLPPGKEA